MPIRKAPDTLILGDHSKEEIEAHLSVKLRLENTPLQVFSILGETPGLSAELYRMLLERFGHDVKILDKLANNASVPEDVRETLLTHFIPAIRLAALKAHLSVLPPDRLCGLVSPETWGVLVHSTDATVLTEMTRQIIENADNKDSLNQTHTILDNMHIPTACIEELYKMALSKKAEDKTWRVKTIMDKIAKHPATPVRILQELYEEQFSPKAVAAYEYDRKNALAQNPSTPQEILLTMRNRRIVLSNPSIPGSAIDECIAQDEAKLTDRRRPYVCDIKIVDLIDQSKNRLNPGLTKGQLLRLLRLSRGIKEAIRMQIARNNELKHDQSFADLKYTLNALETHIAVHPNADEDLIGELLEGEGVEPKVRYAALMSERITPELMEKAVLKPDGSARQVNVRTGMIDLTDGSLRIPRAVLTRPETSKHILLAYAQSIRPYQLLTEAAQVVQSPAQTMMSLGSGEFIVTPGEVRPVGITYLWEAIARHPNADLAIQNTLKARIEAHEINPNTSATPLEMIQKKIALEKLGAAL